MNDKSSSAMSSTKVTSDIICDDQQSYSRKISDEVTTRSTLFNYKINNINFIEKEMIFKSEKVRKYTSKSSNEYTITHSNESDSVENCDDPKVSKLVRNRISAKKSRAKKKQYINELEVLLQKTYKELEYYKNITNIKLENAMTAMAKKETEFINLKNIVAVIAKL